MAAIRPRDVVRVEIVGSTTVQGGTLDNFTSLEIRNDISMPSEASFEIGDDGTFNSMDEIFHPGVQFKVFINDRPRLVGRVEMNDIPFDTQAGAVVRFTVRTKLSDAMYASAKQGTQVSGVTIKQFILALYAPLKYTEEDFNFKSGESRNLMTGVDKLTGETPVNLELIKVDEARVKPPETIYAAADRHLRRHGLMHWDDPSGKIIVGVPNDEQDPIYTFNMFRSSNGADSPQINNVLSATRTRDWSGIPSLVGVFGKGGKPAYTKGDIVALVRDQDVTDAGFYRPLAVLAAGIRTQGIADKAAHRELTARSKRKDAFDIEVDGWSFWDGQQPIIYSPDTVAKVNTDVAGGDAGAYYVQAVTVMRDPSGGDTCQLELVARGVWDLG